MIEIEEFTKSYDGFLAVRSLSLQIERGEVYGFIGPNGAGKTTTIRFLATLLEPTAGTARINGFDVVRSPWEVRRSIGFMPDSYGVYNGMRVGEFLDFFALAYGVPRVRRRQLIDDVLALVDLDAKKGDFVNALSRGMKQRLCLARTLIHDPPVLILDEPASGLDPRARVEIKEILRELATMGKTILISSHILTELADVCSSVAIMESGSLVASGRIEDVLAKVSEQRRVSILVLKEPEGAQRWLEGQPDLRDVELVDGRLRFGFRGDAVRVAEIASKLADRGHQPAWIEEHKPSLETAFLTMTEGRVQ
ncbi:MAG: ABC transporter ATP-binding protein [Planctomycetes bacterium]|nr:ABC transporter ATP-binding protein [Planctomycetota bacterium]